MTFLLLFTPPIRAQSQFTADQLAAVLQQPPLDPSTIPFVCSGYWLLSGIEAVHGSPLLPCRPDWLISLGAPVYALGGGEHGEYLVDDTQIPADALASQVSAMSSSMGRFGTKGDPSDGGGAQLAQFDTNGLWLEISNTTPDEMYLNLHNATNHVYAIWSATNLPPTWQVETAVWPATNSAVAPFIVPALSRPNLFLLAEDWTGVTENGNTTPDWWFWEYFGTTALSDTNLDSQGNTLGFDYASGFDPNVIQFSIEVTNNYHNSGSFPVQLNISAGIPSSMAILLDDTNFLNAQWVPYEGPSPLVNLGSVPGWHYLWIGLRGLAPNASQTWHREHLNLALSPLLVITNPVATVVSQPTIQVYGYCQESLSSISYDISNALGVATSQPSEITGRLYDTNVYAFTTSYFECLDVPMTNGLNIITIHAVDLAGNVITTNFTFTLDYSCKTNPPVVQVYCPQNGTQIGTSNFTCRGWINDPTATVGTQLVYTNGDTNVFVGGLYTNHYAASVERNGNFWLENLPLTTGSNAFAITFTDAVGNTTVTNISVTQSALLLTINPVLPDSQLWQPTVNLTGTISDPTYAVWVNGTKGHNNTDGTWSVNNAPVNTGGTATFTATAYSVTEQQPDGSYGN